MLQSDQHGTHTSLASPKLGDGKGLKSLGGFRGKLNLANKGRTFRPGPCDVNLLTSSSPPSGELSWCRRRRPNLRGSVLADGGRQQRPLALSVDLPDGVSNRAHESKVI